MWEKLHGLKPAVLMVVVQVAYAGMNVVYKLAIKDGMSMRVLVAYRFLFATAFTVPLAYFLERKSRPKLTWMIAFQAFLCGLFGGSLAQNLYVASLDMTSLTFVTAMMNLIPATTFVMAILFGYEKLGFGYVAGKAKVFGTLIAIGGAMLLTLYKGVEIPMWATHVLDHIGKGRPPGMSHTETGKHVLGASLALLCCLSNGLWLNVQAKMSKRYPCYYSSTALMCIMGSLQAIVFALCMERDWAEWRLGWNVRLFSVAYSGVIATGVVMTLIAWCVSLRGPLFVSVFNPVLLILVAFAGAIFFKEHLYLGSVFGGVLIVIGLYAVLWGKAKEMKRLIQLVPSDNMKDQHPIHVIITTDNDGSTITPNGHGLHGAYVENKEELSSSSPPTNPTNG